MQHVFGFGLSDVAGWHAALGCPAAPPPVRRRTATGQLVKSMLSARTLDAVSIAAYDALVALFPTPELLAAALPAEIEAVVAPVTFAADKAAHLAAALAAIGRERPDYDLAFLAERPLADALAWLERLPGVGRKVSASTLNAGTLALPVMIVDTHVLRVLKRLGFVGPATDYRAASEAVTAAMPDWSGDDFLLFHIALKRLGQTTCRWELPECGRCPLAADCPMVTRPPAETPGWTRKLIARMG
jgi:endonuclease-3